MSNESYITPEWLELRQKEYDRRMAEYGAPNIDPASFSMWATHQEVIWEIDALPISQGGRREAHSTSNE